MRRTIIRATATLALAGALAVGGAAIAAAATPIPTTESPGDSPDPALGGIETVGGAVNGLVSQIPGPLGDVD